MSPASMSRRPLARNRRLLEIVGQAGSGPANPGQLLVPDLVIWRIGLSCWLGGVAYSVMTPLEGRLACADTWSWC